MVPEQNHENERDSCSGQQAAKGLMQNWNQENVSWKKR